MERSNSALKRYQDFEAANSSVGEMLAELLSERNIRKCTVLMVEKKKK
jgi:hypothetical protein